MHSTTTFDRIVALYHEAGDLLAKDDLWTAAERGRYDAIRSEIDQLWPKERQERARRRFGQPQLIGGGTEADQQRTARALAMMAGGD